MLKNMFKQTRGFIYVFTHNKKILNTLSLLKGVYTFHYNKFNSTDETIKDLHKFLIKKEN